MQIQCVVNKISGNSLHVSTSQGEKIILSVDITCEYFNLLQYINRFDIVSINKEALATKHLSGSDYMIIEPHYLIPVTSVLQALSCHRINYVKYMGVESPVNRDLQQKAVEGNLLHNVFSQRIVSSIDIESAFKNAIETHKYDLLAYDIDEKKAELYLQQDGSLLGMIDSGGQTELDFENWNFGLHGKIDGILSNGSIIELKSSKIPDAHPWPDHNIQMSIYTFLINQDPKTGKILYISDGQMAIKESTPWDHVKTVIARNYSYLVYSGKYIPKVLRGSAQNECNRCFERFGCRVLCSGQVTQRDCDLCTHTNECDKEEWATQTQEYSNHFVKLITTEQQFIQSLSYERITEISELDYNSVIHKMNNISFLILEKKIEENFFNGEFISKFVHSSKSNSFRRGDYVQFYLPTSNLNLTKYYQGVIIELTDVYVVIRSKNPLHEKMIMCSSSKAAMIGNSRQAVTKFIQSSSRLSDIIISSIFDQIVLPDIMPNQTLDEFLVDYNSSQTKAIIMALNTNDFYLIQGPAGTGKTSVITEIIYQLHKKGKKVLVTAYTNMAIDNVGRKLHEYNLPFIRLGSRYSVDPTLHEYLATSRPEFVINLFENKKTSVVLATTSLIANQLYDTLYFDYVLIDEAAQMTEPEVLKALRLTDRFIMVGDQNQLPPIILSKQEKALNLSVSLFERLVEKFPNRTNMLLYQYRMNNKILAFPNKTFYDNQLQTANEKIANQELEFSNNIINKSPFEFINIINEGIINQRTTNILEGVYCCILIYGLLLEKEFDLEDVCIITTYRAQVALLRMLLPTIRIDTIDRYQGSESDIVILSSVTKIVDPILTNPKRWNVALTRGRKKLIILATNANQAASQSILGKLWNYSRINNFIKEIKFFDNIEEFVEKSVSTQLENVFETLQTKFGSEINYQNILKENLTELNIDLGSVGSFMNVQKDRTNSNCSLCYELCNEGLKCKKCLSIFHKSHLIAWLDINDFCPICKIEVKNSFVL
jgi:DNA replication ATP-dependent helicase Dna2